MSVYYPAWLPVLNLPDSSSTLPPNGLAAGEELWEEAGQNASWGTRGPPEPVTRLLQLCLGEAPGAPNNGDGPMPILM